MKHPYLFEKTFDSKKKSRKHDSEMKEIFSMIVQ